MTSEADHVVVGAGAAILRGHTAAPTIMIAERAAALIRDGA